MKRATLVSIVVVVLVSVAGCQALNSNPERTDEAESTLAGAQTALQEVRSYRYDTTMELRATVEGEPVERDITVTGAVNGTEKRLGATTRVEDESATSYVDNRTVYRACGGMGNMWANESMTIEESWIETTAASRQLRLLEEGDLHVAAEKSDAQPGTTVLVGKPSPSTFEQYRDGRPQPVFGGTAVSNISVRVVIDDETNRPLRSTIFFEISGDSGSGSATIETRFVDYDEPVDITIPDEVHENLWETGCPGS